jgi:hypothetical protein
MTLPNIDDWAKRSAEPVAADLQEGTYLLSLREQKYFALNVSAAAIWRKLATPMRLSQIRDEIAAEFDAEPEAVGRSVMEFVARLSEQKIVTVQPQHLFPD